MEKSRLESHALAGAFLELGFCAEEIVEEIEALGGGVKAR